MINIALCDDNIEQVELIGSFLESNFKQMDFHIIKARSSEELLHKITNVQINIAFLDIEMGEMNGIELGEKIRLVNKDAIIIFITGFGLYAINAFKLKAFDYIIKPISEKKFLQLMEGILLRLYEQRLRIEQQKAFIFEHKNNKLKLRYEEIYYFEKINRKIRIYSKNNIYEYYETFRELKKKLDMDFFIQCHQGYIVNKSQIYECKENYIYIRELNQLIPISRSNKHCVYNVLENNLFS